MAPEGRRIVSRNLLPEPLRLRLRAVTDSGRAGRVHDDRDPHEADGCAKQIEAVGSKPIHGHPPRERPGDEHTAVRSEDPPELRRRLPGRDEPVDAEGDEPRADPQQPAVLPDTLPDQPGAADLSDCREHEQNEGSQGRHRRSVGTSHNALDLELGSKVYRGAMGNMTAPRRYKIAEVSRLTGFSASALRFYEDRGVLRPPERTESGYRQYDDRDVERLRLIARAKELGCTLEEITGLVQAWEADECAPVKHQLRSLVGAKVAEVQRHIAEQTAFAAQLQATAAQLASRPADGPCDDDCGCASGGGTPTSEPAPVSFVTTPTRDTGPPIACTLDAGQMDSRITDWQKLLTGVDRRDSITSGVRLTFAAPARIDEIARLAAAEHGCCAFFSFAITIDHRGVALEVSAPLDAQDMVTALFGAAA